MRLTTLPFARGSLNLLSHPPLRTALLSFTTTHTVLHHKQREEVFKVVAIFFYVSLLVVLILLIPESQQLLQRKAFWVVILRRARSHTADCPTTNKCVSQAPPPPRVHKPALWIVLYQDAADTASRYCSLALSLPARFASYCS